MLYYTSLTTPYLLPWPAPTHNTTLINPITLTTPATSHRLATLSSRDPLGSWERERKITEDGQDTGRWLPLCLWGGWVTNMFVTSAELSWVLTQCLDQPRVAEKPGKSPIPLKEVEIWTNHLKPLPGAFTIKPQIVKTPSRCVCHSFAPGRGFDDLWLYSKCTGKGFWRWEGVLWFVAL